MPAPARSFTARNVQLARALFAAIAAVMITFSPDHSAAVGLAVFGGFGITTAMVLILAAILVHPSGHRWPAVMLGAFTLVFGMAASIPVFRSEVLFFVLIIAWAALTGLIELIAGIRMKGTEGARDAVTVGTLGLLLAASVALVPIDFTQAYSVEGDAFTLTGIVLAVGLFGGYAAIVAVFLGIAGLAPVKKGTDAQAASAVERGGDA